MERRQGLLEYPILFEERQSRGGPLRLVWRRGDVLQVQQASGQELRMPLAGDETQDGTAGA